jgi:MoxR-like ATPase
MENRTEAILGEVRKVIIGKDDIIRKVFAAILSRGHVLLEDVPGVGKTTLAVAFSRALGLDYRRVQFTSDSMPSDVIGFSVIDAETGGFVYKAGAVMTNLLLADEINRTSSKTQSALLEAMEEGGVTVDGVTHAIPEPFLVLATQNPVGSAGTQLLPASQLDRFMVRLRMGYPDHDSQISILKDRHTENPLAAVGAALDREGILEMQGQAAAVHVSDIVYDYVTGLAEATRGSENVSLGVSPRGALAVCQMAKSVAFMQGRDYAVPEDVAAVFTDVCAHRMVLSPAARMTQSSAADVARVILEQVEMPVA